MSEVVSRDGTRIFYRVVGAEHPAAGGLLLCHPSFSCHRLWHLQESALAAGRRVVSWDYRGHGLSAAPAEAERYTLAAVLEDLQAVHRAALGGEPMHLGGLSLGGTVAMAHALAHPGDVRSLLLINTGPGFRNPAAAAQWADMVERSALRFESAGVAGYLEGRRASADLLGLDSTAPQAAPVREGILRSTVAGLTRFARGVAAPVPNLVDCLAELPQPALVLVGEKDEAFQPASRVLEAKLPAARRVEIPGAGHAANLDRPAEFLAEVLRFIAEP